ncbi:molybdopterin cofactor-binding domain-containing protein [Aquamicrobium sp. LC103]|uniref:xanthine dehydrogenase family protein molybdopterin-binding subunit n=1 Tax=Aquamicrobium sp. LC103 TaxID=1120658 RepID=UPI00063EAA70|nr:molybdopterin cofactor-binding domain-containing protein [Aquamicrobium sp. LC103]TKT81062.1 xanthine dehydrogenase family protein molybdopterin-binding subunit [Aquamicrobium sp. LC103]
MTLIDTGISRRTLIRSALGVGGGMMLGFHIPGVEAAVVAPRPWTVPTDGVEINAWLTIDADGAVTIRVPHTEQGQGALTAVSMMVAEELDVPWESVHAVFADMNRHVNDGREYIVTTTHGSQLVRMQHPHIMRAGASARERLKQAAAEAWGIDRSEVTARQGTLAAGDRSGAYAEFATAAAGVTLDREPEIRAPGQWWLLGTEVARLDVPVKVNGGAHYAIDTRLDGMVYAAVKNCPVPWGHLVGYDAEAAKDRPGVVAVVEFRAEEGRTGPNHLQDAIAVVADSWYRAKTALDLITIEWDFGPEGEVSDETQAAEARRLWEETGEVSHEEGGDTLDVIASSDRVVSAEYHRPYETHARMEPINATVSVTDERVEVWSPTQDQTTALEIVADQLGRDRRDVHVNTVFIGGAFGGDGGGNTAVTRQAAVISEQLGRPAKVIWTREEDISQDKQRPPHYTRLAAALGEDGLPEAFFSRAAWFTYQGASRHGPATADYSIGTMPYRVANRRHERHNVAAHIPTTTHRAPGANQNGFIIEQFVDEMALAGGWDPLEWRIEMTRDLEPWQRVLAKLKEVAGFTTDLPRGEGVGVAVVEDHGSYCGACATVSVSRGGELRIEKIVLVMNSGYIINPLNCAEQMEGAACWELSHALYGGLRLEGGRFTNLNFDSYNLMRIDQMPEVETHFALSEDGWWGGVAEPGGPPTPAAVANAIFFATGKRVRSTPMMEHDLSWS